MDFGQLFGIYFDGLERPEAAIERGGAGTGKRPLQLPFRPLGFASFEVLEGLQGVGGLIQNDAEGDGLVGNRIRLEPVLDQRVLANELIAKSP